MLTYNSRSFTLETWVPFRAFVVSLRARFGARAWAACLEESLQARGSGSGPVYHVHAYLLWTDGVGLHQRALDDFYFENVRPRIDVCKGRMATTAPGAPALHGLWYVAMEKDGTKRADTNFPAGVFYKPLAAWLQSLYQDGKLCHQMYIHQSAAHFAVGHATRKRDADEALRDLREAGVADLVQQQLLDLKDAGLYKESRQFAEADEFVSLFAQSAWRRPVLLIIGATNLGKSMLGARLLERVGETLCLQPASFLEVTVEDDGYLDFSGLNVMKHCGVLLDGIGDVLLLKKNRETLQGRPKVLHGGRSQTMRYAYPFTLARRAVVATMDLSADNLHLLETDHWLADPRNVKVLRLTIEAWVGDGEAAALAPLLSPMQTMGRWRAADVRTFLKSHDLEGPAAVLFANGFAGNDFATVDVKTLTDDIRLSIFAARKVLAARDTFLLPMGGS